MITRILAVSSATLSLLALTVLPVSAASLTSDTSAVVGAPNVGVSVGASGSATTNTGTSGSGSATVDTGTQTGYGTGSNSTTGTSGSVTTTGSDDSTPLSLSSTDQAVVNFSSNGTAAVSDANTVSTRDQLSAYAAGVMHADANIQNVQMSNSSVAMDYKQPGRFLGFIPVTVTAHAQVNQDGSVSVTHPWYDFLTMTNDTAIRTSIQTQLQQSMNSMASTTPSGSITLSPQMQAQIMADMHTAFSDMSK